MMEGRQILIQCSQLAKGSEEGHNAEMLHDLCGALLRNM